MPRDAVSRTANVERNGGHKWVKALLHWAVVIEPLEPLSNHAHFIYEIFFQPGKFEINNK